MPNALPFDESISNGFEPAAELPAQAIKSLARAGRILGETKAEDGHVAAFGEGQVFV